MLSINPERQTERENYKLLIGSIVPRPIAFVTSVTKENIINGAPFSYFNIVSANPPMISISIQRKDGEQKDTARNISRKKEFVVHIVDEQNVEEINKTAVSLPPNESEITGTNLTVVHSECIETPGIQEARVRFECIVEQHIELSGEDGAVSTDLMIGKIVQIHIDDQVYKDGKIVYDKLKAVSRLAGNDYAKVGEIFSIDRPK